MEFKRIFWTFGISLFYFKMALWAAPVSDSLPFPASWSGQWEGELNIYAAKGLVQHIPMTLDIQPVDTSLEGRYTWGIIYGSKDHDWRPYELVPVDTGKGVWKIDEKNTILMESYLIGPKFLCWFVVEGSRILCTYEKTGPDELIFEVLAGKEIAVSSTGKNTFNGEEIPEVITFPLSGFQRAVLKRKQK